MYLSFQDANGEYGQDSEEWDIARCKVTYAGNVNLPYRYYTVTDHMSFDRPYYGGLDVDL